MKERPILFSAPMVRAILSGQKTQTRRVVKPQPEFEKGFWCSRGYVWSNKTPAAIAGNKTPYGQPGDRLWVRETWQGPILSDDELEASRENGPEAFKNPKYCVYRATDKLDAIDEDGNELGWIPSIHMNRWASRITLEITGVRVERLQDISVDDAKAEGLTRVTDGLYHYYRVGDWLGNDSPGTSTAKAAYKTLWESINGPGSWALNPWVWVLEFKRI